MNMTALDKAYENLEQDLDGRFAVHEYEKTHNWRWLRAAELTAIVLALFVAPIFFGAVHPENRLVLQALFFFIAAFLCLEFQNSKSHLNSKVITSVTFWILLLLPFVHNLTLSLFHFTHPIFGNVSRAVSWPVFLDRYVSYIAPFAVFLIALSFLQRSSRSERRIRLYVLSIGLICSMIALSHWFYDNGLLFWTFAPEFISVSDRARWPFVNPNHLGHFLLPIFFVTLAELENHSRDIFKRFHGQNRHDLAHILGKPSVQKELVVALVFGMITTISLITILATLSRSSWIALSVGLLLYLYLQRSSNSVEAKNASITARSELPHSIKVERKRRVRRKKGQAIDLTYLSHLGKYAMYILLAMFVFMLLKGRGSDLIVSRIDYALMYSLDDIRLTMLSVSTKIFLENPYLGVGFGEWEKAFGPFTPVVLADINPEYLHSDPIQMLVELGVFGGLPIIISLFFFVRFASKTLKIAPQGLERSRFAASFIGLLALFFASFMDFPFRIPAISYLCAILLASTLWRGIKIRSSTFYS